MGIIKSSLRNLIRKGIFAKNFFFLKEKMLKVEKKSLRIVEKNYH